MAAGRKRSWRLFPLTYWDAGVDLAAGEQMAGLVRELAVDTPRRGVVAGVGGFGAVFDLAPLGLRDPLLVSATDGVGTKLRLAVRAGALAGIGIDLVAMCANDVLAQGAAPLFFLDYLACGRLDVEEAALLVAGIARGCRIAGASLVGGETAEMPGAYREGEYDLAGFCVGAVERERLIDGAAVREGDLLVALPSSGAHANGCSVIRKIFAEYERAGESAGRRLRELLAPPRMYVPAVAALLREVPVRGIAHITGGGLPGNLVRILPEGLGAAVDEGSWRWPELFRWLQDWGEIEREEMYRVFNCGIGMVLCIAPGDEKRALDRLAAAGEPDCWVAGRVERVAAGAPRFRFIRGGREAGPDAAPRSETPSEC